ncbi:hypothetical protein HPB50_023751 [Hyalomma asiaticum]|uniref:Uncharacterized protein n=1 Tax=Hyalomma asiaticum TaxID=266040 RepID=A0ACB7T4L2_HYAAI|nr:hypothetical protein HPB50_023751 [Hyalomma asiaticum]
MRIASPLDSPVHAGVAGFFFLAPRCAIRRRLTGTISLGPTHHRSSVRRMRMDVVRTHAAKGNCTAALDPRLPCITQQHGMRAVVRVLQERTPVLEFACKVQPTAAASTVYVTRSVRAQAELQEREEKHHALTTNHDRRQQEDPPNLVMLGEASAAAVCGGLRFSAGYTRGLIEHSPA